MGGLDAEFTALHALADAARATDRQIMDLFQTPHRAAEFSVRSDGMLFDYSKTLIDDPIRGALLALATQSDVEARRDDMFAGKKINTTEDRAVLHTALRNPHGGPILVDDQDVMEDVRTTLAVMERFADSVRQGQFTAAGGPVTDVVNIGIGGSDLGPVMATRALAPYCDGPRCHFVSNIDGADLHDTLEGLDPARTLVIVASKSFTTIETMTNAHSVRDWMQRGGVTHPGAQFVAVSSAAECAEAFGIAPERIFGFGDYVGGRFSIWGPVGLSLMLAIGPRQFRQFLSGGAAMDAHFQTAPLVRNMPVMLALCGIWHNQILGYGTRAVLPYDHRLGRLPAYLQQLEMESNGKRVHLDGSALNRDSAPVIWGEAGTNGQHAFYQMLHQGTRVVPCEFLIAARGHEADLAHHHRLLIANCLAQSEALMRGRDLAQARTIAAAEGVGGDDLTLQAAHRVFPGNRPSTTLAYDLLTPFTLGRIIALYEHRVFVEGTILGINSFDQWGVELGKELAVDMVELVQTSRSREDKDESTRLLLDFVAPPQRKGAPRDG